PDLSATLIRTSFSVETGMLIKHGCHRVCRTSGASMSTEIAVKHSQGVADDIAVHEWVRRRLGNIEHELRVARVSEFLFDLTRRWHNLGRGELKLLKLSALVHDVGRSQRDKGHAKIGAKMIFESSSLSLSDVERRRLAFLTRYHRGNVPNAGEESFLSADR